MRAHLCPTFWDPMDGSPPSSSVLGILQAGIPEWIAISFSRGSSWTRHGTQVSYVSCIDRCILQHSAPWEAGCSITQCLATPQSSAFMPLRKWSRSPEDWTRCPHVLRTRKGPIVFSLWKGMWEYVEWVWSVHPGLEQGHLFPPSSGCSYSRGKQRGAGATSAAFFSSSLSLSQSLLSFHLVPLSSASCFFPAYHPPLSTLEEYRPLGSLSSGTATTRTIQDMRLFQAVLAKLTQNNEEPLESFEKAIYQNLRLFQNHPFPPSLCREL